MAERVRSKKDNGGSETPARPAPRGPEGMYMQPVMVASIATRITYREKAFNGPGGDYYAVRRYYAGAVQIGYAQVGEGCIKLSLIDHPDRQQMYVCRNDKEVVKMLQDRLIASAADD